MCACGFVHTYIGFLHAYIYASVGVAESLLLDDGSGKCNQIPVECPRSIFPIPLAIALVHYDYYHIVITVNNTISITTVTTITTSLLLLLYQYYFDTITITLLILMFPCSHYYYDHCCITGRLIQLRILLLSGMYRPYWSSGSVACTEPQGHRFESGTLRGVHSTVNRCALRSANLHLGVET